MTEQEKNQKAFELVRSFYKNRDGRPFEMTPGQIQIFRAIYEKQNPRNQVESFTQFGKSNVVGMAVLTRASTFPEKWAIIGGTKDKAGIIMSYIIKHIFENEYTLSKFKIGKDESLERIKRERSKERLTFRIMGERDQIGEILILSGEARRAGEDAGDILVGWGSPNIICDDAPLIPDQIHGKMMRMLGNMEGTFLMKIGNTIRRNHFLRSHNDPNYKKIIITYQQGIEEGRTSQQFIDEMRREMDPLNFSMFYECQFPPEEMIEEGGWIILLLEEEIRRAIIKEMPYLVGEIRLGIDVAKGGGNWSVITMRCDNFARIVFRSQDIKPEDLAVKTMEIRDRIIKEYLKTYATKKPVCFVDAFGPGAKTYGKLKQHIPDYVIGVMAGDKATDAEKFFNKRAEMAWRTKEWILGGGKLMEHSGWEELKTIKYKAHFDRRVKIMTKDEMARRGLPSPDCFDSLALTFAIAPSLKIDEEKLYPQFGQIKTNEDFDPYL